MTITITQDTLSPQPILGVSAMDFFFYLLVAYGITFGIQHKASFLRGRLNILDQMLICTYCTGFHAGWITWLMWNIDSAISGMALLRMLSFAMASSAFSYFIDTSIRLMETYAEPVTVEEEEND